MLNYQQKIEDILRSFYEGFRLFGNDSYTSDFEYGSAKKGNAYRQCQDIEIVLLSIAKEASVDAPSIRKPLMTKKEVLPVSAQRQVEAFSTFLGKIEMLKASIKWGKSSLIEHLNYISEAVRSIMKANLVTVRTTEKTIVSLQNNDYSGTEQQFRLLQKAFKISSLKQFYDKLESDAANLRIEVKSYLNTVDVGEMWTLLKAIEALKIQPLVCKEVASKVPVLLRIVADYGKAVYENMTKFDPEKLNGKVVRFNNNTFQLVLSENTDTHIKLKYNMVPLDIEYTPQQPLKVYKESSDKFDFRWLGVTLTTVTIHPVDVSFTLNPEATEPNPSPLTPEQKRALVLDIKKSIKIHHQLNSTGKFVYEDVVFKVNTPGASEGYTLDPELQLYWKAYTAQEPLYDVSEALKNPRVLKLVSLYKHFSNLLPLAADAPAEKFNRQTYINLRLRFNRIQALLLNQLVLLFPSYTTVSKDALLQVLHELLTKVGAGNSLTAAIELDRDPKTSLLTTLKRYGHENTFVRIFLPEEIRDVPAFQDLLFDLMSTVYHGCYSEAEGDYHVYEIPRAGVGVAALDADEGLVTYWYGEFDSIESLFRVFDWDLPEGTYQAEWVEHTKND